MRHCWTLQGHLFAFADNLVLLALLNRVFNMYFIGLQLCEQVEMKYTTKKDLLRLFRTPRWWNLKVSSKSMQQVEKFK